MTSGWSMKPMSNLGCLHAAPLTCQVRELRSRFHSRSLVGHAGGHNEKKHSVNTQAEHP